MVQGTVEEDKEVAAILAVSAALGALPDPEARQRVISYVLSRFMPGGAHHVVRPVEATGRATPTVGTQASASPNPREIPGIARLTDGGEFRITIRNLKARSGLDAAVRLAMVAVLAHHRLTGLPLSSRRGLTPLLREWRVYDGNTRARLARERGIQRDGDNLSLDAHARQQAERFMQEMLDDSVEGRWSPT